MHSDTVYVVRALKAGAMGYVTKREAPQYIVEAIRTVMRGDIFLSKGISGNVINQLVNMKGEAAGVSVENLTNRELEIFEYIGLGFGTGEISKKINLSVNTVETHRKNIKEKLGIVNGKELVKSAIQWVISSRQ